MTTMLSPTTEQERGQFASTHELLKILHVCNGLDPIRDGGMVPSILGMTGALADLARENGAGGSDASGVLSIVTPNDSRKDLLTLPRGVNLLGPGEADIRDSVGTAGVAHLHGLWQAHTRIAAAEARRSRVPYIIAAHGMAEPWALKHKYLKKAVYLNLIEKRNLRKAGCLHALARPEIGHLRALAPKTPVALVPNGVHLETYRNLPARAELEQEFPDLEGKFVLLFFGRLHVKKGLDMLAEAFGKLAPEHSNLHLLVAGTDDGAWTPFVERMTSLGVSDRITALGHVSGRRALQAWGAADAFTLPSRSEGFSMAVLEALACGLPCLITKTCHFPELERAEGAVVVEPTIQGVELGLLALLESSKEELRDLARRGKSLVEKSYTWKRQAERLLEVYQWMDGGGPKPTAVLEAEESSQ